MFHSTLNSLEASSLLIINFFERSGPILSGARHAGGSQAPLLAHQGLGQVVMLLGLAEELSSLSAAHAAVTPESTIVRTPHADPPTLHKLIEMVGVVIGCPVVPGALADARFNGHRPRVDGRHPGKTFRKNSLTVWTFIIFSMSRKEQSKNYVPLLFVISIFM